MCGICGIAWSDGGRPVGAALLRGMAGTVTHRGPDSEGFFHGPGVGLGVRRLSIIDVTGGDQPLFSEDRQLALVCNGEIYNHPELREELEKRGHRFATGSDAEVVVHLYEEHGPDCVLRLRGMFAFALWDAPRRRLLLARDRLGIKPLCYHRSPEGLIFGSEAKAILRTGRPSPALDPRAVRDLMTLGYVLGPGTFFAGVRRLMPGHRLLFRGGDLRVERYWRPEFPPRRAPAPRRRAAEWAAGLREKIEESVRLHLRSDVPLGAWLSPGVDSSAVAALAAGMTGRRMPAYSLGFEDPACDELSRARLLSDFPASGLEGRRATCTRRDFDDLPRIVWHGEGASALGIEVPRWVISRRTGEDVKAVLTGEGADELFGGYRWFAVDLVFRLLRAAPSPLRRAAAAALRLHPAWKPGLRRHLEAGPPTDLARYEKVNGAPWGDGSARLLSGELAAALEAAGGRGAEGWTPPPGFDERHPFCQLQYCEMTIRLPHYIEHHLDHMAMAHSLETRVPFLDHELVEYCALIPPSLKMRWLKEKHILRRSLEGVLPSEILRRRKRGLHAPLKEWLRGPLPEFAEEMLSARSLRRAGYFRPGEVRRLLARHRGGERWLAAKLMAVLIVQLWDELFVRRGSVTAA